MWGFMKQFNLKQRRLIRLYVVVLLICFGPSKAIGALVPIVFLFGMFVYVRHQPARHLMKYIYFLGCYTVAGVLYYSAYDEFSFGSYYFFLITSSSLLVLLYDFRQLVTESVLKRMANYTLVILVIEAFIGISQGLFGFIKTKTLDSSTGDYVRGTIELSWEPAGTGSNQMFAILVSTLLLFVLALSGRQAVKEKWWSKAIVFFSWLQASVVHTIVYLVGAIVGTKFINILWRRRHKGRARLDRRGQLILSVVVVLIVSLMTLILPRNIRNLSIYGRHVSQISEDSYSQKSLATYYTLYKLSQDEPLQPWVGLGTGQYSSRAALIRSGQYLSANVPVPIYVSKYTNMYILSLWEYFFQRHPLGGSTYFPFYSWLSVYGETGIAGTLLFIGFILWTARRITRYPSTIFPYLSLVMVVLLAYLVLLGLQDVYWEFAQAIFPAVLILRMCTQYLGREYAAYCTGQQAQGIIR